ncbi:integrase arm-type DNA-binding domain-containing protein [Sphingomonas sp. LB2R24]|uniref:integrase arm-type DNA-binding domain-containing protein n=1 Tax=Sphingomonas sorbitolis TaxID=3096165 RepID=UPI002FC8A477
MPTIRLTIRSLDAAQAAGRDTFFWDPDLRGFGLKVTAAGAKNLSRAIPHGRARGKTRRYTIGKHGIWTPPTARTEAERFLRLVATGIDPQAASRQRGRLDQELAFANYAERFRRNYGKREWRPRTYASAESNVTRRVLPVLGRKSLPEVSRRDIIEVLDRLPPDSPALPRNVFALVRKLFAWAVKRGDLDRSPLDGMKSPPESRRAAIHQFDRYADGPHSPVSARAASLARSAN